MNIMAARVNGFISTVFALEYSSIGLDTECTKPANAAETIANTYPKRGDEGDILWKIVNLDRFNICHNKSDGKMLIIQDRIRFDYSLKLYHCKMTFLYLITRTS